jgi:hypothetical protein
VRKQQMRSAQQDHMQPWCVEIGIGAEPTDPPQSATQRVAKAARQSRQGAPFIRIRVFHPQITEALPARRDGGEYRGEAIFGIDLQQLRKHRQALPCKDQSPPRKAFLQQRLTTRIQAQKTHETAISICFRIARYTTARRLINDFGRTLGLEARATREIQASGHGAQ